MRGIAVDVAFVDVVQSRLKRNFAGRVQRFGRRSRLVSQLEVGVEGGKV